MKRIKELPDISDIKVKKVKSILTQEDVNELFEYKDGDLYWKIDIYSGINHKIPHIKIGDKTGCIAKNTGGNYYKQLCYNGKIYKTARLIFLMHNGYLPEKIIYKDGNTLNTRIKNLLEANSSQTLCRTNKYSTNKTGYRGVFFDKKIKKYKVYITKNNKQLYLGSYNILEEASKIYEIARKKYYGDFINKCTNNRG